MHLKSRLRIGVVGYQFKLADNRCDLNWLWLDVGSVHRGDGDKPARLRALSWELADLAAALDEVADRTRSQWHSRLMDSGLSLSVERHADRGSAFVVVAAINTIGGPLAADTELEWNGDRAEATNGSVHALRMVCSPSALRVFAVELREDLRDFPVRLLPKNRLHLGQPH